MRLGLFRAILTFHEENIIVPLSDGGPWQCRQAFPHLHSAMLRIVEHLKEKGPRSVVNMTRVLECLGMDVIGEDLAWSRLKSSDLEQQCLRDLGAQSPSSLQRMSRHVLFKAERPG